MQFIVYHGEGREIGETLGFPPVDRSHNNLLFYIGIYYSLGSRRCRAFVKNRSDGCERFKNGQRWYNKR